MERETTSNSDIGVDISTETLIYLLLTIETMKRYLYT